MRIFDYREVKFHSAKFGSWRRHGVILVIVNKLGEKTMWFPVSTPVSWLK